MIISNNLIKIEQELIITFKNDNPNNYNDSKWVYLDKKGDKIKAKKIYIDDTNSEIDNYGITNF